MDRFLLPIIGLVVVGLIAAGAWAGLPKTKKGGVGDTLQAHAVSARLITVKLHPEAAGSGMFDSAPAGKHFVATDVGLCNRAGGSVNQYSFKLELTNGSELLSSATQTAFSPQFEGPDSGCEHGWLVFQVPDGQVPKALKYRYDGTDGSTHYGNHRDQEHDRFSWTL